MKNRKAAKFATIGVFTFFAAKGVFWLGVLAVSTFAVL